ncbi:transcriptional regulator, TetR family [Alkaliphilus metalliredigens QYMF]|uniref:Transcriptional regulator, TetR family n=1 Tax=Alkaliphilus metalliredigens (strain QYMF) TaxID=293826 RepID=A6TNC8_ALKMQ|nr:TetR/AcrR family transcriptional regulator [Alkaliphilus metalliredigens]ABR47696.1 transcriptional regulator, TetR family [Alkaliphilus metalliredigens QYMF]
MLVIFSKFLNLENEKQQRILNAALKEFARKGYDDASTIEIAKEAGISKGLLFHYFHTKRQLFLYLYDYSMKIIKTEYFDLININERDLFTKLRQVLLLKIELIHKLPWVFQFSAITTYTSSEEVRNDLESKKQEMESMGYEKIFENIDESKFQKRVDIEKTKNIIFWAIGGFANKIIEETKGSELTELDYDGMLEEFDAYLEILKKWAYTQ